MTKEELKVMIDETINSNGVRGITGKALNLALTEIVDAMGTTSGNEDEGLKRNDVNFFDYDGTLLYAYTWEEASALTELPALPVHDGLEVREWNYTLEDIKAQGTETNIGKADVGACVYDGGEQVQVPGIYIFERGTDDNGITGHIRSVVAWLISIPNTVSNLYRGFIYKSVFLNELKVPISVTYIDNVYGGAFESSRTDSVIWWNGAYRHFTLSIEYGISIQISDSYSDIYLGDSNVTRYILGNNIEVINGLDIWSPIIFDFTRLSFVPTLYSSLSGSMYGSIIVPDELYDEWINATNWSSGANKIFKHSDFPWLK